MNNDFMKEMFVKTKSNMTNQIMENFLKEFTKEMIKKSSNEVLKKSFEQAKEKSKNNYIKSFEPLKNLTEMMGEYGKKALNNCHNLYDETINNETLISIINNESAI